MVFILFNLDSADAQNVLAMEMEEGDTSPVCKTVSVDLATNQKQGAISLECNIGNYIIYLIIIGF